MGHLVLAGTSALCAIALGCGSGPPTAAGADAGPGPVDRFCGNFYCLDVYAPQTVPDLGSASGADLRQGRLYLLGDRNLGVVREYVVSESGTLEHTDLEIRMRDNNGPIAPNPSALSHRIATTVLGDNTNGVGTIFFLLWDNAVDARDLRTAVISRVDDDLGRDPTGPEIIEIGEVTYIATADGDASGNQVRLYDPDTLAAAAATSEPGLVAESFDCGANVRSLFGWQRVLVLVQSVEPPGGWQLSFLDLAASIAAGEEVVVDQIRLDYQGGLRDVVEISPGRLQLVADTMLGNVAAADLTLR